VRAVLACAADDMHDAQQRLVALDTIRTMPDFEPLAAAFKRIKNILKQAAKNTMVIPDTIDNGLLTDKAERRLFEHVTAIERQNAPLVQKRHYVEALKNMVSIKPDADTFFEAVMVMVEQENVRANRLALLAYIDRLFCSLIDFSQLQG